MNQRWALVVAAIMTVVVLGVVTLVLGMRPDRTGTSAPKARIEESCFYLSDRDGAPLPGQSDSCITSTTTAGASGN